MQERKFGLVLHGGAGDAVPDADGGDRLAVLRQALATGYAVLERGGSALDAAIMAVMVLEDCPLFNAGRGSVLAANGEVEMDACVMDGQSGRCGGVSAVRTLRNPITAARLVMERSPHSLLCVRGAEDFARAHTLAEEPPEYFRTPARVEALARMRKQAFDAAEGLGTVGAVALDREGNLAAATSTGGLTGKLPGRVSDSSIAGAGTWAANSTCALSCTGTGDIFIRNATARDVACMIEYGGCDLDAAAAAGLRKVAAAGGSGGIIGLTPAGHVVMQWNTEAMRRGHQMGGAEPFAAL